jgi:hypothetical protein
MLKQIRRLFARESIRRAIILHTPWR